MPEERQLPPFHDHVMELAEEAKSQGTLAMLTLPIAICGLIFVYVIVLMPRLMGWEDE